MSKCCCTSDPLNYEKQTSVIVVIVGESLWVDINNFLEAKRFRCDLVTIKCARVRERDLVVFPISLEFKLSEI